MRFLVQRVKSAELRVDNKLISSINEGLLVFVGVENADTKERADYLINKLVNLRIFKDEQEKMNLSVKDIAGELMIVSQFTLYADCTSGNRPSFTKAGKPDYANELYKYVISECKGKVKKVGEGVFGANMQISLVNDGPVTIMLER